MPDVSNFPHNQSPTDLDLNQVSDEFRQMLRFALGEGLELDDKTRAAIAAVPSGPQINFANLLAGHAALSKIIAPATPLSLEATAPTSGPLGSLRRPPLIMWMIIVGIVAATGFVVTNILLAMYGNSFAIEKLNWCFAAGLGAVFYVLFTAHKYVKDRTFDPRYNAVYLIRFVLGVLSGLILAIVLGTSLFKSNPTISNLGPAVIALLGGFSTEAVYQILQRLVDILLAAVRGDNSDTVKAKASQVARNELLTMADDPALPPDLKSKAIAVARKVGA
jgi:hypothetical protein